MEEWNIFEWGTDQDTQDGISVTAGRAIADKALKRVIKNDQIHFQKAQALNDLCYKPKLNEQWRIITQKSFNAYAMILSIIADEIIEELYLAIYRINEPTVLSVIELIEQGKIQSAYFVISNFFNQTKKPEKWAIRLREYADKKHNCKHVYTHNHSKVLAAKTALNYYVFEGSGNMSDNARIEQYVYENNKQVFEFHKNWIKSITK